MFGINKRKEWLRNNTESINEIIENLRVKEKLLKKRLDVLEFKLKNKENRFEIVSSRLNYICDLMEHKIVFLDGEDNLSFYNLMISQKKPRIVGNYIEFLGDKGEIIKILYYNGNSIDNIPVDLYLKANSKNTEKKTTTTKKKKESK